MDKVEACRHLHLVVSRESDPKIRGNALDALDVIEKPISVRRWLAVLRVEFRMSEEGRVETDFGVVKVVDNEDEAMNIVAHRRDASRNESRVGTSRKSLRTYILRLVEE